MSWRLKKTALILAMGAGLWASGCAGQGDYKSPYVQEEDSSRAYRALYPNPFTLDQGPTATTSGDE